MDRAVVLLVLLVVVLVDVDVFAAAVPVTCCGEKAAHDAATRTSRTAKRDIDCMVLLLFFI